MTRRHESEPEDSRRFVVPERVCIVDTVAAREREQPIPYVRPTDRAAEIEMALDQPFQTQVVGQGGRQKKPGVGG
jgi:hypothetical protein